MVGCNLGDRGTGLIEQGAFCRCRNADYITGARGYGHHQGEYGEQIEFSHRPAHISQPQLICALLDIEGSQTILGLYVTVQVWVQSIDVTVAKICIEPPHRC